MNLISSDRQLVEYLGRPAQGSLGNNTERQTKNGSSTFNNENEHSSIESPNKTSSFYNSKLNSPSKMEEKCDPPLEKSRSTSRGPTARWTMKFKAIPTYTDKEIVNILEEFKAKYPLTDKNVVDNSENTCDLPDRKLETFPLINGNTNSIFIDPSLNTSQKSQMFKTSIYNKLIPNKMNNTVSGKMTKPKKRLNKPSTTKFGPYLNFDYEGFNRVIEIKNPKIKKNLEDIKYYGPFFSHCPSCKNRNLEFYQTMETNQCLKLLQFLKKTRVKSHLNPK